MNAHLDAAARLLAAAGDRYREDVAKACRHLQAAVTQDPRNGAEADEILKSSLATIVPSPLPTFTPAQQPAGPEPAQKEIALAASAVESGAVERAVDESILSTMKKGLKDKRKP